MIINDKLVAFQDNSVTNRLSAVSLTCWAQINRSENVQAWREWKKKNVKSLKLKVQKVQTVQLWLLYRTEQSESVRTVMCSVLLVLYSRTLALRWNRWLWSQSADFHLWVSFPASYRRRFQTYRQDDKVLLTDQVGHFASVQLIVCFTAEKPTECKVLPKPVRGDSCSGIGPAEQPNIEEDNLIWRRRVCILCGCKQLQAKAENQDFNTSNCFISDLMCGVKSQHTQRHYRIYVNLCTGVASPVHSLD